MPNDATQNAHAFLVLRALIVAATPMHIACSDSRDQLILFSQCIPSTRS